jgi:alkylation response protein AidB-like acyl-CoA dehydrogenase
MKLPEMSDILCNLHLSRITKSPINQTAIVFNKHPLETDIIMPYSNIQAQRENVSGRYSSWSSVTILVRLFITMSDSPHSTAYSGFQQQPPKLYNPFTTDSLLQRILTRYLGPKLLSSLSPTFTALAEQAISPQTQDYVDDANRNLPSVRHWDGWGTRKDELLTSQGWKILKHRWAQSGMMQDIYSRPHGSQSRIIAFTKYPPYWYIMRYYLIAASSGGTTCPLAMTDGVTRCLELHAPKDLRNLSLQHLTSRDSTQFWTSGQWMTERSGGSDISGTETRAYPIDDNTWIIKGFKWFSSATDSDITLILAKTPASHKLSVFWTRVRNDDGTLNGIRIIRLKDKFGTKQVPTAELELTGMKGAVMIGKEGEGIKVISEVLNITRVHCAMGCITGMRRAFSIVTVIP